MSSNLALVPEPKIEGKKPPFRIFISYASEDLFIAEAIGKCLRVALDRHFSEINLDRLFLQPGSKYKTQIESKLEDTDVLVIVYTGVDKPSHGYTGWEVGYFDRVMKTAPNKKKVSVYLEHPPDISLEEQGICLKIAKDHLQGPISDFESNNVVSSDDPFCQLIHIWQQKVAEIGQYDVHDLEPYQNPVICVRDLRLEIFRHLKTMVDVTLKPQKQITIKVKGCALPRSDNDLPPDAELVPAGSGGPMSIFGLQDDSLTWEKFLQSTTASRYRDSWRDAITNVVMSSFPNKIDVDNSQIIVSNDEAKLYRIILTTATRRYDDSREFNLYFVEALPRQDIGDPNTTKLLKGLELVCRFRFLFLESDSEFGFQNVQKSSLERLPELVSRLLKELNLLRKDARDLGLDQPYVWSKFVTWEHIDKMTKDYRPHEVQIRSTVASILEAKGQLDRTSQLQQELAAILKDVAEAIRPENTLLLREMTGKLQEMAEKI